MSCFVKYASIVSKQISIYVATEFQHAGYKRAIDIIDQIILSETMDKVKAALEKNNKLFSAAQASRTSSVTIT